MNAATAETNRPGLVSTLAQARRGFQARLPKIGEVSEGTGDAQKLACVSVSARQVRKIRRQN